VPKDLHYLKGYWPLKEVDVGARREHCDWELTERIRQEGFAFRMPDIHPLRTWGQLLKIRCHLELEERDLTKAIHTCQTGMALGRHISDAPVVVTALIGAGIGGDMLDNVQTIIATPGSPNLYWALTALPRPFLDLRRPLQGERLSLDSLLADVTDLDSKPLSLEKSRELLQRFGRMVNSTGRGGELGQYEREALTLLVLVSYPAAKEWLLAQGKPAELVEQMPTFQVVLLYSLAEFRRLSDDLIKLHSLHHPEAGQHLEAFRKQLTRHRLLVDTVPLAGLLLPAHQRVFESRTWLERRIDVLRVIEALRLYAAAHGEWPATLAEIKNVPIPLDIYLGKPFVYRRDGNKATLIAPSQYDTPWRGDQIHYELTLEK
jgi:hypothetical protein